VAQIYIRNASTSKEHLDNYTTIFASSPHHFQCSISCKAFHLLLHDIQSAIRPSVATRLARVGKASILLACRLLRSRLICQGFKASTDPHVVPRAHAREAKLKFGDLSRVRSRFAAKPQNIQYQNSENI